MFTRKRVLICPLDWGLGHATRCVTIIRTLIEKQIKVLIAADGRALAFLQKEFPNLEFIIFPGYNIHYSKTLRMELNILLQSPKILFNIRKERKKLSQIIEQYQIDAVISDNRFGCYSSTIPSIFITHQLMIKCPTALKFLEPLLHFINLNFIHHFNECWIPDSSDITNLSGNLSHFYPISSNMHFIGPLSRFENKIRSCISSENYILMIFSGPEPQRSILEEKLLTQASKLSSKFIVIRGITEKVESFTIGENIIVHNHLETEALQKLMTNASLIITRSGYSTIMDLAVLEKNAALIPTPHQTEQVYLAKKLLDDGLFFCTSQSKLNLAEVIEKSKNFKGLKVNSQTYLLENRIDRLIEKITTYKHKRIAMQSKQKK